jgi:hypothetical protein
VYVIQKALGVLEQQIGDTIAQVYKPRFSLIALDKNSGQEAWRFSELRDCARLGYCSSPVVTNNCVFFGWGEGRVFALDKKTGEKMWSDSLGTDIISSPAIADGKLYLATMAGQVFCYSLSGTMPGLDFQRSTYCFPNPARGRVSNIQVYVSQDARVSITLYNMAEQPVLRINREMTANEKYAYAWDLNSVANGAYIAYIKAEYSNGKHDIKLVKIAVLK